MNKYLINNNKRYEILEANGHNYLLVSPSGQFIIALGYDPKSKTWDQGKYYMENRKKAYDDWKKVYSKKGAFGADFYFNEKILEAEKDDFDPEAYENQLSAFTVELSDYEKLPELDDKYSIAVRKTPDHYRIIGTNAELNDILNYCRSQGVNPSKVDIEESDIKWYDEMTDKMLDEDDPSKKKINENTSLYFKNGVDYDSDTIAAQISINYSSECDAITGYYKLIPFFESKGDQDAIDDIVEIIKDEKNHQMKLRALQLKYDGGIPTPKD